MTRAHRCPSFRRFLLGCGALFLGMATAPAEPASGPQPVPAEPAQTEPAAPVPPAPEVEKTGPTSFRIGEVSFDSATREIQFPAIVNMQKGMIEFPVVHTNGRTHEAIFASGIFPLHLETALRLLRYQPSAEVFPTFPGIDPENPPDYDKWPPPVFAPVNPESHLQVFASWQDASGQRVERDIRHMLVRSEPEPKEGGAPKEVRFESMASHWVFTGSKEEMHEPVKPLGGCIVGVRTEEFCTVNAAQNQAIQSAEWFVDPTLVPEPGTKVTIHFRPVRTPVPSTEPAKTP